MIKKLMVIVSAALLALPMVTSATPVINNTGITSPDQTITFSEFVIASEAPVTN